MVRMPGCRIEVIGVIKPAFRHVEFDSDQVHAQAQLPLAMFRRPFAFKLEIERNGRDEPKGEP